MNPKPNKTRGARYLALVMLSCSCLFAETVMINEFMALNSSTLPDQDGDYSDWIELYNPGTNAVNLGGWYLSDDALALTKWTLPATNVPAGGYLLVFASGKDRAASGRELHTNFKLGGAGEYLGLILTDGVTAVSQFAPTFSPQITDISYGSPSAVITHLLLTNGTPCTAFVPTSSALGTSWVARTGFDDSGWLSGATAVGYGDNYTNLIGLNVGTMYNTNATCYARIPFTADNLAAISQMTLTLHYDDGFVAYLNGTRVAAGNAPATPLWNSTSLTSHEAFSGTEVFDMSAYRNRLVNGVNLLAVHALNSRINGPDLLVFPELQVVTSETNPTNAPVFLMAPTPGWANTGKYVPTVAPVQFSHLHGFYDTPFDVTLSCATSSAEIRYTTDFSAPTPSSGMLYTGPVTVTKTTCLRACGFMSNYLAAAVTTMTYLFPSNVIAQSNNQSADGFPSNWVQQGGTAYPADYGMDQRVVGPSGSDRTTIREDLKAIPTMSIVTTLSDMFSQSNGIYANPTGRGVAWERPASVEYFDPYGDSNGFQVNCGVRIQGELNRNPGATAKHSFRFLFKTDYGPGKLHYPLFKGNAVTEFDTITLRGMYGDSWARSSGAGAQYLRDQFAHDTQRDMGSLASAGNFVHLYVNGLYWGLYNANERVDQEFMTAHVAGAETDWDVIEATFVYPTGYQDGVKEGYRDTWNAMMAYVTNTPTITTGNYAKVKQYLDMPNFIDYMMLEMFVCNFDWPMKNWVCAAKRSTNAPGPPELKFQFFTWDTEASLGWADRTTVGNDSGSYYGPAIIYKFLRTSPEFQRLFGDRVQKHLLNGGALCVASNVARYWSRAAEINHAIVGESARWGDWGDASYSYTRANWLSQLAGLSNSWFLGRTATVLGQFKNAGLFPSIDAPVFNRQGGAISAGFMLSMSAAAGTAYYTTDGSDPALLDGSIATTAFAYSTAIPLADNTRIMARAKSGSTWSAVNDAVFLVGPPPVRITELMYHPADPPPGSPYVADDFEFIEFMNIAAARIALAGISLTNGVRFTFAGTGVSLDPSQCAVIVKNRAAFATRYNTNTILIAGEYLQNLSNNDEWLRLKDALYGPILEFQYHDNWYPGTDGGGYSLTIVDPFGARTNWTMASGWILSAEVNGSPGVATPEPAAALALALLATLARRVCAVPAPG